MTDDLTIGISQESGQTTSTAEPIDSSRTRQGAREWQVKSASLVTETAEVDQIRTTETSAIQRLNELAHSHYAQLTDELDTIHRRATLTQYECLSDPYTLFLLRQIVDAGGLHLRDVDTLLANSHGWARAIRLVKAGLVDLAGDYLRARHLAPALLEQAERIMTSDD